GRMLVLRRKIPRVLAGPAGRDALPMDLLPADPIRRDNESRPGVGLGRSDERAAGVPEPHWSPGPERPSGPSSQVRDPRNPASRGPLRSAKIRVPLDVEIRE